MRGSFMKQGARSVIIISASSDIGTAMCKRWLQKGYCVFGTYRTKSIAVDSLIAKGATLLYADLSKTDIVEEACVNLKKSCPKWDILVMCPGTEEPVGLFIEDDFTEWERSIKINFTNQMRIVHNLLSARQADSILGPSVILFAGGGANNAPKHYSAYIISKIALTKMCELLDAEIPDTRFTIIGPGWVKTKIHEATLKVPEKAGVNYKRTLEKLSGDECTPMEKVLDCCDWIVDMPRKVIGGRNISVVFDKWGTKELEKKLSKEYDMYKLRRFGNEWLLENK